MRLIIEGFIVHVILLLSIFDIYFKSPIITGIEIQKNYIRPPAKRLVLFVADGLRADSFFVLDSGTKSPFLRNVVEEKGTWGVCHARVPTESRPGHVALIAGFYEDPSAVFKGWKENPVEFDSLFNQSTTTYSWGSPDILPMFSKGAAGGKVHTDMYSPDVEDFSGRNESASNLNDWVFEKTEEFLKNAKENSTLFESLNRNGVIFFLHLLGTDIAGHVNKPHSKEYKEIIESVDIGVEKMVKLVTDFYNNDNSTVFIFTSDHGMTDWGSHGDGSVSETETPVVVWGAGIAGPQKAVSNNLETPENWSLSHLSRRDVQQADLVPLMAVLIGVAIPVHSVGMLPLSYLNVDGKTSAEAMYLNSKQLVSHFKRHQEIVEKDSIAWLYKPFPDLNLRKEEALYHSITKLIDDGEFEKAIEESKSLISLALAGLKYYQNYYQNLLLFSVSCSYIGWIAWLLIQILPFTKLCNKKSGTSGGRILFTIDSIFLIALVITIILIFVQMLPIQYYVYCCLPIVLWWAVFREHPVFLSVFTYMQKHVTESLFSVCIYGIGIELLVLTFFIRRVLCIVLCGLGVWPLVENQLKQKHRGAIIIWMLSCFGLAVFPTLPTVGSLPNVKLVIISGWLWFAAGLILIINQIRLFKNKEDCLLLVFQLSLFPITVWLVCSTADSYESKLGLPFLNQILSWSLLVLCPVIPFVGSVKVLPRLGAISLSLAVPFLLLSIGHEAFFILVLMTNLFTWISLEKDVSSVKDWEKETKQVQEYITRTDFRRAFFFIVYIILSFFGTGNIASVNSFDLVWVRCFLTVFSPFTMTILILLKILVPFLLVSCSFQALNIITKAWTNQLFIMMLILCDFMGLHFLYAVTNEGSWLEIGTSISHYVIIQVMILFIVILNSIANFYMQSSFWFTFQSKTKYLPGQSLESRAVYSKHKQYHYEWSLFDKRHVE
ncbi:phosphatidylinositol glycan anchor biosynthesis class N [Lycorma delicatula]|uniref:phosphatidylinositol glycan anchor biosynthesis class N n=1 Tax=Lycorma delicatula TaxID=130591 RepID=UPI003F51523C